MDAAAFALLAGSAMAAGTVLALGALGLLLGERSGVVNLGAEGVMLLAALAAYATCVRSGSDALGFAAGMGAGALVAALFGWLVVYLHTNQYATGLAFSLFGTGLSAFLGLPYTQERLPARPSFDWPLLRDVPGLDAALAHQHPVVLATPVIAAVMALWMWRTRSGLTLRAVGEAPHSAQALGHRVQAIRLAALVAGGALCGLAGAYLSLAYTPLWVEGMVAGRGWIALALTTFATWRPGRVLIGAYLFGGVTMWQLSLQAQGVQLASQWLSMLPYLATILVLVLMSRNPAWLRANMPASLGQAFHPR